MVFILLFITTIGDMWKGSPLLSHLQAGGSVTPRKSFIDVFLGPGVNPLEGSPNVKLWKVGTEGTFPDSNSRKG